MVDSLHLGEIIEETGGLGKFQIIIWLFVELCTLGHSWSLLLMSFGGAKPDYFCSNGINGSEIVENTTDVCQLTDGTKCSAWTFAPDMRTIVTEFSLVCDRKWFTQTITTIQMSGMLVGSFLWGHICDAIGRKYTLYLGVGLLGVFNLICVFSVNWEMFAAMRFMIGVAATGINTSTVLFEFIRNKWRFWIGSIPVYSIFSGLLALFCWMVADWRYICVTAAVGSAVSFVGWRERSGLDPPIVAAMRFMIALAATGINQSTVLFEFIHNKWRFWIGSIPVYSIFSCLFCWKVADWRFICVTAAVGSGVSFVGLRFIPESYRWLVARGRFGEAEVVIKQMAHRNGRPVPDLNKVRQRMKEDLDFIDHEKSLRIYTIIDLFRTWKLFKITTFFAFIWLAGMFSYFGIQYDVPQLTGNLYLNMFLVALADVPSSLCVAILNLKFGRKWTSFGMNIISGILCIVVAVLQRKDKTGYHAVIIGLVIAAKFASNSGWITTSVWTLESYPTVIRHIGKGLVDCLSRIGALLAPQFITLSFDTPGLLYFVSGGLLILAGLACVFLEETRDKDLEDILPTKHIKV